MNNKKIFRKLVRNPLSLVTVVALGILEALIFVVQMNLISQVVSQVFQLNEQLNHLGLLLFFLLIAIILHAGFVGLREFISRQSALAVKLKLRNRVITHLSELGPAYTRDQQTGELVAVTNEGIERLEAYISRYLPQVALSA